MNIPQSKHQFPSKSAEYLTQMQPTPTNTKTKAILHHHQHKHQHEHEDAHENDIDINTHHEYCKHNHGHQHNQQNNNKTGDIYGQYGQVTHIDNPIQQQQQQHQPQSYANTILHKVYTSALLIFICAMQAFVYMFVTIPQQAAVYYHQTSTIQVMHLFVVSCGCYGIVWGAKVVGILVRMACNRMCQRNRNRDGEKQREIQGSNGGQNGGSIFVRVCGVVGVAMGIAGAVWRCILGGKQQNNWQHVQYATVLSSTSSAILLASLPSILAQLPLSLSSHTSGLSFSSLLTYTPPLATTIMMFAQTILITPRFSLAIVIQLRDRFIDNFQLIIAVVAAISGGFVMIGLVCGGLIKIRKGNEQNRQGNGIECKKQGKKQIQQENENIVIKQSSNNQGSCFCLKQLLRSTKLIIHILPWSIILGINLTYSFIFAHMLQPSRLTRTNISLIGTFSSLIALLSINFGHKLSNFQSISNGSTIYLLSCVGLGCTMFVQYRVGTASVWESGSGLGLGVAIAIIRGSLTAVYGLCLRQLSERTGSPYKIITTFSVQSQTIIKYKSQPKPNHQSKLSYQLWSSVLNLFISLVAVICLSIPGKVSPILKIISSTPINPAQYLFYYTILLYVGMMLMLFFQCCKYCCSPSQDNQNSSKGKRKSKSSKARGQNKMGNKKGQKSNVNNESLQYVMESSDSSIVGMDSNRESQVRIVNEHHIEQQHEKQQQKHQSKQQQQHQNNHKHQRKHQRQYEYQIEQTQSIEQQQQQQQQQQNREQQQQMKQQQKHNINQKQQQQQQQKQQQLQQ